MNKTLTIIVILFLGFISCSQSDTTLKEKELELKEKELQQKEELLLKEREQDIQQKEKDLQSKVNNEDKKTTENDLGEKHIAVINDPDGYTNVRNGMSAEAKIIDRLYEGEHYEVFPSTDSNWWVVYTQSNVKGYVHKSRVRIID